MYIAGRFKIYRQVKECNSMYRILIVEDDSDINQMICEYLNGEGFCCSQAFSGSEGKLLFSMSEFDLVILDLMLPGIPGCLLYTSCCPNSGFAAGKNPCESGRA